MGDYHHGDLANALLQSARIVLDEKGIHGISLQACAAHAGVSHAAPTHHFKSLCPRIRFYQIPDVLSR